MVERRPLVISDDGCPIELPAGDTLPGSSASDDFLSAVFFIASSEVFTIPQFRQMVVHEELIIDDGGELIVEGQLFLEP